MNIIGLIKGLFVGHAFYAVFTYRVAHWLYLKKVKLFPDILKYINLRKFGCEIMPYATIGESFTLHHTPGIIIGHEVVIGNNCEVFQNVTIGSNRKMRNGRYMPIIGDNVSIGAGAVVVGAITIGNNVIIGANSYVSKDVPDNVMVVGSPAKIVKYFKNESTSNQ